MNLVIWLVLGGVVGWLASWVMQADGQGILLNIGIGVAGSLVAGLFISPLVETSSINAGNVGNFSPAGLLVALVGSITVLALVNLVRRGAVR
jgi:uncharacterized membrane protein YeaQ/YmgE (transglycosylase-associated protein family)